MCFVIKSVSNSIKFLRNDFNLLCYVAVSSPKISPWICFIVFDDILTFLTTLVVLALATESSYSFTNLINGNSFDIAKSLPVSIFIPFSISFLMDKISFLANKYNSWWKYMLFCRKSSLNCFQPPAYFHLRIVLSLIFNFLASSSCVICPLIKSDFACSFNL